MEIGKNQFLDPIIPIEYLNLLKSSRYLMAQLPYLTRAYFTSVLSGYGNADAIVNRLESLPKRFKDRLEFIFGTPLTEEFFNILSQHVMYVQGFIAALKTGDMNAANDYAQLIYKNSDDISSQYAEMNPFWDVTQWKALGHIYTDYLIEDAIALYTGDFENELDIFERMLMAGLAMGDYFAEGLYQYIIATRQAGTSINKNQEPPVLTFGYLNMVKDFRYLMTQLAYLTRLYFASVFSEYGTAEAVANKLYSLPYTFLEKAELIFGTPLSEEFMNLLSMHVSFIQYLADALKTGNQDAANNATQQLYKNADDLAVQYARMNPFWDEIQWKTLLHSYVNLLIQNAVALASRDFEKEMDIFDRMLLTALMMGDYLADGFIQYITARGRGTVPTAPQNEGTGS